MSDPNMFDHLYGRLTHEEGKAFVDQLGFCRTKRQTVATYCRWLMATNGRPNRYAKKRKEKAE